MSEKKNVTFKVVLGLAAILIIGGILVRYQLQANNPGPQTGPTPTQQSATAAKDVLPQSLRGLPLQQEVSGPQAIAMISKMHNSDITIKQGYIGTYGGSQGQITLWISESNNAKDAEDLFAIMDQEILAANQNSTQGAPPFTNRKVFQQSGLKTVSVDGMGMQNYYLQKDTRVYWVGVTGLNPTAVLDQLSKSL